jgi:hypothetical protein
MIERTLLTSCAALLFAAISAADAATPNSRLDAQAAVPARDGSHDFDFWFGKWTLANHRLKHRLANSNEWEDCGGSSLARPLLGGRSNMDETIYLCGKEGIAGAAFRLYDPKKDLWSIFWIGTGSMTLDPPVIGRFVDGIGTFYGDDTFEGKPVRVRFIWSKIDLTHAHWEQAFSVDGGKTWETNWTQELTRTAF